MARGIWTECWKLKSIYLNKKLIFNLNYRLNIKKSIKHKMDWKNFGEHSTDRKGDSKFLIEFKKLGWQKVNI